MCVVLGLASRQVSRRREGALNADLENGCFKLSNTLHPAREPDHDDSSRNTSYQPPTICRRWCNLHKHLGHTLYISRRESYSTVMATFTWQEVYEVWRCRCRCERWSGQQPTTGSVVGAGNTSFTIDDITRCYTMLMADILKAAWLRLPLIAVVMKTLSCSL